MQSRRRLQTCWRNTHEPHRPLHALFLVAGMVTRLVAIGLVVLALLAGVWKLWHTADKAGYARAQQEYRTAAEQQREQNRETAGAAEKKESVRVAYRDRYIVTTVKEIRDAVSPLASCELPGSVVGLLNDASKCANQDGQAACSADDGMQDAK